MLEAVGMDELILGKTDGRGMPGGPGATDTEIQVGGSWKRLRAQERNVSQWEMSSKVILMPLG